MAAPGQWLRWLQPRCHRAYSRARSEPKVIPSMHPIELVLCLFGAVALLAYLAARIKVPYPIFLVLGGLALSRIPNLPRVALEPDLVLLLFLPPILYYAGLMTSWRDFKANRRPI